MKSSGIGGQAVLEGVMMRNKSKYAVAVRKPDGEIFVQKEEYHSVIKWQNKKSCRPLYFLSASYCPWNCDICRVISAWNAYTHVFCKLL